MPKFGEWDVNDPASAEGVPSNRQQGSEREKDGGKPDSPPKDDSKYNHRAVLGKPHSVSCNLAYFLYWLPF